MKRKIEKNAKQIPRQRLLEAAGEIFAEHGFKGATVREICRLAETNIATVNYYFGGKEKLYSAVLQFSLETALYKHPPDLGRHGHKMTPGEQLHSFVLSFLLRIFDLGRPSWHGKITTREMFEPSFALDTVVEKFIRPLSIHLESIVRKLLGDQASQKEIRLCAKSIIGQLLLYRHALPVIVRLHPEWKFEPKDIKNLASHISRFSIGALREYKKINRILKTV